LSGVVEVFDGNDMDGIYVRYGLMLVIKKVLLSLESGLLLIDMVRDC
jgi:hypothetical protein